MTKNFDHLVYYKETQNPKKPFEVIDINNWVGLNIVEVFNI